MFVKHAKTLVAQVPGSQSQGPTQSLLMSSESAWPRVHADQVMKTVLCLDQVTSLTSTDRYTGTCMNRPT